MKVISKETHEYLDKKTLQYVYRSVARLMVSNYENHYGEYSNGKDTAYGEVLRIITDILS